MVLNKHVLNWTELNCTAIPKVRHSLIRECKEGKYNPCPLWCSHAFGLLARFPTPHHCICLWGWFVLSPGTCFLWGLKIKIQSCSEEVNQSNRHHWPPFSSPCGLCWVWHQCKHDSGCLPTEQGGSKRNTNGFPVTPLFYIQKPCAESSVLWHSDPINFKRQLWITSIQLKMLCRLFAFS